MASLSAIVASTAVGTCFLRFRTVPAHVATSAAIVTRAGVRTFFLGFRAITAHVATSTAIVARTVTAAPGSVSVHTLLFSGATLLAANRLVIETFARVELLLFRGKREVSLTIAALQRFVGEFAGVSLFDDGVVFRRSAFLVAASIGFNLGVGALLARAGFRIRCHNNVLVVGAASIVIEFYGLDDASLRATTNGGKAE